MSGRNLGANARLAAWHDGKRKPDDEYAFLQQRSRHLLRQSGVAQHDRDDRVFTGENVEVGHSERVSKKCCVLHQPISQVGGSFN